jgi:hypothetical protein
LGIGLSQYLFRKRTFVVNLLEMAANDDESEEHLRKALFHPERRRPQMDLTSNGSPTGFSNSKFLSCQI